MGSVRSRGILCGLLAWTTVGAYPGQEPPMVAEDCIDGLEADGVVFRTWNVRPRWLEGRPLCAVPHAVRVVRTPSRIRYNVQPRVNCAFARRLVRFERVVQEEARRLFRRPIARIEQLGTYACRRMAAYPDWVSEHAFANAIDLRAFVLAGGRRIDVLRHFVKNGRPTERKEAVFLRRLARRLYDEGIFSVVLTPNFDRRHANHFHLDGAPYTVDGT